MVNSYAVSCSTVTSFFFTQDLADGRHARTHASRHTDCFPRCRCLHHLYVAQIPLDGGLFPTHHHLPSLQCGGRLGPGSNAVGPLGESPLICRL